MRLARFYRTLPRLTLNKFFRIFVLFGAVCLVVVVPIFLLFGPKDSSVEESDLAARRNIRVRNNRQNQVESPEGNQGVDDQNGKEDQINLPAPENHETQHAVIDAFPADRFANRESENDLKHKRNIPKPRLKSNELSHAESKNQNAQKVVIKGDRKNQVIRPPPSQQTKKNKNADFDYEEPAPYNYEDHTAVTKKNKPVQVETIIKNDLKLPVFNEIGLGNYEVTQEKRDGPGEYGVAVHLSAQDKKLAQRGNREYGFNQIVSDRISLDRAIPDTRPEECKHWNYPSTLPKVSVVIAFHNEMWSTLMRTVHSVINRTPPQLLEEVLLVDDYSDKAPLKEALEKYIVRFDGKVRLIRNKDREGLIRTRSIGAKNANGEVVFFLDAHCEVGYNWLPPLLAPIARDRNVMTVPVIDGIDSDTFEIHPQYQGKLYRGIFEWGLLYKETELPAKEMRNRKHFSEPYKSPTHAGGLFAIDKEYFLSLGGYDEGLQIWGGEQYELSFKIWQCGGSIEWVPCSHIGHIYRGFMPYGFGKLSGKGPIVSINLKRVAETWMDEYKEYYYVREPLVRALEEGDISKQKALREKLQCKSFKWYMENVAYDVVEKYPLLPPNLFWGELRNVKETWRCWDSRRDVPTKIDISPCHGGGGHQLVRLNAEGQLGIGERCVEIDRSDRLELIFCPEGTASGPWSYLPETQQMKHRTKGSCVERQSDDSLVLKSCSLNADEQKWQFHTIKAS